MIPFQLDPDAAAARACCGKTVCLGCVAAKQMFTTERQKDV
jgi:hypothetical protein